MNRIYISIISIIVLCFLGACNDDFLNRSPRDSAGSGNMWTTDNLTDMGVAGVYQTLRVSINTGGASGYELYHFDQYGSSGQNRDGQALVTGSANPSTALFTNVWKELYEGIHRANDAIYNIPLKSPSSAEKKARYIAECKFLRAYFYTRLVQLFKDVPVYLEPITDDKATRGQEKEDYVWKEVIIKDLTDCINTAELPNKIMAGNTNYGHVTKGAAYALRGKAYLYIKEYEKAVDDFKKVKECGYSTFRGDYKDLFKKENEQSDEMIFTLQHIEVSGYGSTTQFFCGTRSSFGSCWNTFSVHPSVVDKYEYVDGTPFNWDRVIPGYSAMAPKNREVYFIRDTAGLAQKYIEAGMEATAAHERAKTIRGLVDTRLKALPADVKALYLPSGNEARLKAAYEGRDLRLKANVITPYSTYLGAYGGTENLVTLRWPSSGTTLEPPPLGDLRTDAQSMCFYWHRKFVYEGLNPSNRIYGPTDFPIIRYADVLLMWAEALNAQNKYKDAIPLINEVRARAGVALLQDTDASKPTYVSGTEDMFKRIQKERAMEFVNEGITFFDELRWKTWKTNVFEINGGSQRTWGEVASKYTWQGDWIYTWPVPASEIQMNPNLAKTDGWIY